jgi:hypothetical protein
MDRREALRNVAILMAGTLSASTLSIISGGCNTSNKKKDGELFTAEQQLTIAELADTIIPPTSTPGAKAAGVGPFIAMMIAECYPEKAQKMFIEGLDDLDKRAQNTFSNSFATISAQQRTSVLQQVVDELKKKKEAEGEKAKSDGGKRGSAAAKKDPNFFQLAKELTMLGYFTSEIGAKQALVYLPVPGKYDPCIDMEPGQKAWAL